MAYWKTACLVYRPKIATEFYSVGELSVLLLLSWCENCILLQKSHLASFTS